MFACVGRVCGRPVGKMSLGARFSLAATLAGAGAAAISLEFFRTAD